MYIVVREQTKPFMVHGATWESRLGMWLSNPIPAESRMTKGRVCDNLVRRAEVRMKHHCDLSLETVSYGAFAATKVFILNSICNHYPETIHPLYKDDNNFRSVEE